MLLFFQASPQLDAWGVRAHTWINRVAVRTIPDDGPVFLKAHEDWIAYLSVIPDTWRRPSEPFIKMLEDPFTTILAHLDEAGRHTEQVYQLEKSGALADPANAEARALVIQQTARGAALLRDLAHTAWVRSGEPPVMDPGGNPIVPAHPRYNPRTGSAPAHLTAPSAATGSGSGVPPKP